MQGKMMFFTLSSHKMLFLRAHGFYTSQLLLCSCCEYIIYRNISCIFCRTYTFIILGYTFNFKNFQFALILTTTFEDAAIM